MRNIFIFLTFASICLSCKKKNDSPRTIDGNWIMWYVRDNATRAVTPKPSSSSDVVLRFTSSTDTTGKLVVQSPPDLTWSSSYSLLSERDNYSVGTVKLESFAISNRDTGWVKLFADNFPKANVYAFESPQHLFIYTTNNLLLTFKKQ